MWKHLRTVAKNMYHYLEPSLFEVLLNLCFMALSPNLLLASILLSCYNLKPSLKREKGGQQFRLPLSLATKSRQMCGQQVHSFGIVGFGVKQAFGVVLAAVLWPPLNYCCSSYVCIKALHFSDASLSPLSFM